MPLLSDAIDCGLQRLTVFMSSAHAHESGPAAHEQ